ncbi:MAG: hypothetical protein IPN29_00505 [Saprospiraceae bacterium]|nr:hypothetical protein [Saprospiraceae bacterium]
MGELTAGIAHEIQNPLNFVNNFSEVSTELVEELSEELSVVRINADATSAIALVTDIKTNLEKITHHGKRASEIVKACSNTAEPDLARKKPLTSTNSPMNVFALLITG